jgi:glucosamine kinase
MIEYLIGVDGGGTGTRVRLANSNGTELAQGQGGPSALSHGIDAAWVAVQSAAAKAFEAASLTGAPLSTIAIGLGLSGVHNKQWAAQFIAANPGYAAVVLETDAFTTLMGAHQGKPGAIVALGTGSCGEALLADGTRREVGGWGFPAGDEASGGWIGLRAINHIEQVLDGRSPSSPFARAVIDHCGGDRDGVQVWLAQANQTRYAQLAPLVLAHSATNSVAHTMLIDAGVQVASIAGALDPTGTLPLALCGGLGEPMRPFLPPVLRARCSIPQGDAASGALRMIALHVERLADARAAE